MTGVIKLQRTERQRTKRGWDAPERRNALAVFERLAAKMLDILSGVNGTSEPLRYFPVAIPGIAICIAVHRLFFGFGNSGSQIIQRNAVFFHAASNPQDQAFACLSIEVEHWLIPLASSKA
jgi:hypothetical protein